MVVLKHKILKSIVLRRTKKGRAADLALPPRIVSPLPYNHVTDFKHGSLCFTLHSLRVCFFFFFQVSLRRDTLDIKEEDYYTSLYNESQAQFNTYATVALLLFAKNKCFHNYICIYIGCSNKNLNNQQTVKTPRIQEFDIYGS